MTIDKCPDNDAYLTFKLKSILINTVSGSDTASMMSGFDNMSTDSRPDANYRFTDNDSLA